MTITTRSHRAEWRLSAAVFATAALIALAGCGSSKPAYCNDRANLQSSVKGLADLNASSGVSGLKDQLTKIQSDAKTLVSSAKGDFPSQTSAISSSVDTLSKSVQALPSNPSASQLAAVAGDATSMVTSVKGFLDASSSKCS